VIGRHTIGRECESHSSDDCLPEPQNGNDYLAHGCGYADKRRADVNLDRLWDRKIKTEPNRLWFLEKVKTTKTNDREEGIAVAPYL
jgi:hypothetical protein